MKIWKKTVYISGALILAIGLILSFMTYDKGIKSLESQPISQEDRNEVSKDFSNINHLDLSTSNVDVNIIESPYDKTHVTYFMDKNLPITISEDKGHLTIVENIKSSKTHFNFISLKNLVHYKEQLTVRIDSPNHVTIKLPKDSLIKNLKANTSTGNFIIQNVAVDHISLDSKAGDLTITDSVIKSGTMDFKALSATINKSDLNLEKMSLNAGNLDIDESTLQIATISKNAADLMISDSKTMNTSLKSSAGDSTFRNTTLDTFKIDMNMGSFIGRKMTFKNENTITSNMGDIDISLTDYDLHAFFDKSKLGDTDLSTKLKNQSSNTLMINQNGGDTIIK